MEQQFLFIVMAIASRLYKWTTMSHLSTQALEDGWTWFTRKFRVSQRNIFRTLAEDTWRLLFSNRSKLNYWNRGLTWEVRFSILIWEVRTKNEFKFWTTKPNLDSWAKRLTWFDCNQKLHYGPTHPTSVRSYTNSFGTKQGQITSLFYMKTIFKLWSWECMLNFVWTKFKTFWNLQNKFWQIYNIFNLPML